MKKKAIVGVIAVMMLLLAFTPAQPAEASNSVVWAYVVCAFSEDVYVIDTATNTFIDTVDVGLGAFSPAITPDGSFVYVSNGLSDYVSVIQTSDNTVVDAVTVGNNPRGMAVTPDGAFVYVTNFFDDIISVIDTFTNTVVDPPISVGEGPIDVAITPNGAFAYVVNCDSDDVSVIRTSDNTVVATVAVGLGPLNLAITPDGAYVYVSNYDDDTVSVIATSTNTVVGAPIPVGDMPRGVAITPDGAYAYVANRWSHDVSVIDIANNTVVDTVVLDTVRESRWVAITPDGAYAYVTIHQPDPAVPDHPGEVCVIRTSDNTLVTTIPGIGIGPVGIAIAEMPVPVIRIQVEGRINGDLFAVRGNLIPDPRTGVNIGTLEFSHIPVDFPPEGYPSMMCFACTMLCPTTGSSVKPVNIYELTGGNWEGEATSIFRDNTNMLIGEITQRVKVRKTNDLHFAMEEDVSGWYNGPTDLVGSTGYSMLLRQLAPGRTEGSYTETILCSDGTSITNTVRRLYIYEGPAVLPCDEISTFKITRLDLDELTLILEGVGYYKCTAPPSPAVPSLSQWGTIVMAIVFATLLVWTVRRSVRHRA